MEYRVSELIAPSFYRVCDDVKREQHMHYWLKGGRGSTKSSFVGLMIIMGIMEDVNANAVVIRKVGVYLKDSVYEQLAWAIDKLGVTGLWRLKKSPLEMVYIPTGQKILFRGADKPQKLKSTKVRNGYIRYIWYEECAEFNGMQEVRTINQSLMRGGPRATVFYTYNPPKTQRSWVNKEVLKEDKTKFIHHSTYLDVPPAWLGERFIIEAESLKKTNPDAYRHEYLGEVTGTGGTVFTNLKLQRISDEDIAVFDKIKQGIDFGYAADPFVWVAGHYDKKHKRLFIFDEIYKRGLSNARAAELIRERSSYRQSIVCDAAEPKSIAEMRRYGLNMTKARKGPDSIEYGIKFLQSLNEIIIDNIRCPETAREFYNYELEPDPAIEDGFKDGYPDKNNHSIDAVRYAMESETTNNRARVIERSKLGI